MKQREFIARLGGTATWPLVARAQQRAVPVIGYLGSETPELYASRLRAFRQGLSETGYIEGSNLVIMYRWAEGQYDRIPGLVADLVNRNVAVLAAPASTPAALAAKAITTSIPILFATSADPVALGLVARLNRPGGNLTGVTALSVELGPKLLEVLHEAVPNASVIGVLINSNNPTNITLAMDMPGVAKTLGLRVQVFNASTESDLNVVFHDLRELRAGGVVIGPDAFFTSRSEQLAEMALSHALPAIYQFREFAAAGGLMSYGVNLTDIHRLVGVYAGRILNGERPSELPVQQSSRIELTINMKTAKALGITFPITLLARADEVIE